MDLHRRRRAMPRGQRLLNTKPYRTADEERLVSIVAAYFRRCQEYEVAVCTLQIKGCPLPATALEKAAVESNAEIVLHDLMEHYGLTRLALLEAIRRYAREVTLDYTQNDSYSRAY